MRLAMKAKYVFQPIKNFLEKVRQENSASQGSRPRHPVTLSETSTLEEAIEAMASHRLHRVFIVDQNKKPIGVISIQDILLEIISS